MKKIAIAALIAAQVGAAVPAHAAEIPGAEPPRNHETGAFVGARLTMPFGAKNRSPRASLAAAPVLRSTTPSGEARTRYGAGLELGLRGEQVRFDLGGRPVSALVQGGEAPGGERRNISTVGWVAIGVGVVALTVFALYAACGSGEICNVDDE